MKSGVSKYLGYVVSYFKGLAGLIAVLVLLVLAGIFFLLFGALYSLVVALIVIVAILAVPYFFGKKYEKEKPGHYKVSKVK